MVRYGYNSCNRGRTNGTWWHLGCGRGRSKSQQGWPECLWPIKWKDSGIFNSARQVKKKILYSSKRLLGGGERLWYSFGVFLSMTLRLEKLEVFPKGSSLWNVEKWRLEKNSQKKVKRMSRLWVNHPPEHWKGTRGGKMVSFKGSGLLLNHSNNFLLTVLCPIEIRKPIFAN